jgi:RNA polymerase sigma factor (sigma-70 family)
VKTSTLEADVERSEARFARSSGMLARAAGGWSDERVVRECLRGNEDAWSALLGKYKRLIYSIPIKYGFSVDQATDIFQEVCVELLAHLSELRKPRALPKWLMQVTVHKCAHLRQEAARIPLDTHGERDGGPLQKVADSSRLSEEVLLEVEREQALRTAVASLAPRCRRLVEMLFFETPPRPYEEIAQRFALARGSIGFIRGRCLERLRAKLHRSGFR